MANQINASSQAQNPPLLYCPFSDGHTDSDILMKWANPTIEIGNKQMAQFSVGHAILSTKLNSYSTGKKRMQTNAIYVKCEKLCPSHISSLY